MPREVAQLEPLPWSDAGGDVAVLDPPDLQNPPLPEPALAGAFKSARADARAPIVRSMRAFAEAEIWIPNGPREGYRFDGDYLPATGLLLDCFDSHAWRVHYTTGPSQSSKTLGGSIIPTLYHLLEIGETVIYGVPDMQTARDKWLEDLEPVIQASPNLRPLLPKTGATTRGGVGQAIRFENGAVLRFMTGGGGDKSRAAYTARVLIITEVDGMDVVGASSRETDKIGQLYARVRAFGSDARIYAECTLTDEEGRTNREIRLGTDSKIHIRCPHCRAFVYPMRDHLVGYQDAGTVVEAREASAFHCPACAVTWSDADREAAVRDFILLHKGQTADRRKRIRGDDPATETLGFQWSAVHNLLVTAGDVGVDEWQANKKRDPELADRELCQFVWAIPAKPLAESTFDLTPDKVAGRTAYGGRGSAQPGAEKLTLGIDVGGRLAHWILAAWSPDASLHIADYGVVEIHGGDLGFPAGVRTGLGEFRDGPVAEGWQGPEGSVWIPDATLVDSGWETATVYAHCRQSPGWMPAKGFGASQSNAGLYRTPTAVSNKIAQIGDGYHVARVQSGAGGPRIRLVEIDVDKWKTWVWNRLTTAVGQPGAAAIFQDARRGDHNAIAHHLTSEKKTTEYIPGRGDVVRWVRVGPRNHWLDALVYAAVAGHMVGVRLPEESTEAGAGSEAGASDAGSWYGNQTRR